jgi:hypothetical protein
MVIPLLGFFFVLAYFHDLCCFSNIFPFCIFPSLINDTNIFSLAHVVPLAFDHFVSQFAYVGLTIQPYKYSAWAPSNLLLGFNFPIGLCYPIDNITILGIPFGSNSFPSFFL